MGQVQNSRLHQVASESFRLVLYSLIPLSFLQTFFWISKQSFSWQIFLSQLLFLNAVLFFYWAFEFYFDKKARYLRFGLILLTAVSGGIYVLTLSTFSAWILAISFFGFLIQLEGWLTAGLNRFSRLAIRIFFAGIAGCFLVGLLQLEERFSEEEFFAVLQVLIVSVCWFLTASVFRIWVARIGQKPEVSRGVRIWIVVAFAILMIIGIFQTVQAYQESFFPEEAPTYPGISSSNPYLCGTSPKTTQTYSGEAVFSRLLERIEENPQKGVLEFGLLTAGSNSEIWAEKFREDLLQEARQGLFTQPENSVKYGQCQAARRVYFYDQVVSKYPDLFSNVEQAEIKSWFGAINRKAFEIGWVDWMYALAFSMRPSGPYENQECGAGLLAILEATGLADPEFSPQNLAYLSDNPRGWLQRFRNSDDTYAYQPEWLHHALFQYMASHNADPIKQRLSFEWFLLQAIPDGSPLRYNHFVAYTPGLTAYWASNYFSKPEKQGERTAASEDLDFSKSALWLAGRSADFMETNNESLYAHPGMQETKLIAENSPTWGSCLIFSNSGLPNQLGPLAPDKIVFRDGWDADSIYLLLNLRFTGWHRYKGTNSIILAYQAGAIAAEVNTGEHFSWLPRGRSLLRDKRIPRENLNGLLVERTGLSAVVHNLTSIGSIWAQDPPFFAQVERFKTGSEMDISTTILDNWRGWRQSRTIFLHHKGAIVIADQINGPSNRAAAISWHFTNSLENLQEGRFRLRAGDQPVEMILIPLGAEFEAKNIHSKANEAGEATTLIYQPENGGFKLLTVLLTKDWIGAKVITNQTAGLTMLTLQNAERSAEFQIP